MRWSLWFRKPVVSSRLIRGTRWARLELTTNTARLDRATALADHASGTNIMSGLNLDSPRRMAMNGLGLVLQ
jgi:hypothetical protein